MARPNVVFILIDDMGWTDLSCQGSPFYETPNIDRIAAEGIQFSRAYASCPVCSPTRASIMTGKYPARVGITQWIGGKTRGRLIGAPYLHYLPLEEKTLARALKEHGYRTYHVGKWHLGEEEYWPEHHGFDVNIGGCHWGHPWHGYFSPFNNPRLEDGPEGEYLPDRLTDEALKLLEKNGDQPFFLNMAYYCVHTPIQARKEDIEYFQAKAQKMGLDAKKPYVEEEVNFELEDTRFKTIERRIIHSDPKYAAMIYRLDWNIGRLLDKLRELGLEENTIVIFYSDNGGLSDGSNPPTSNLPLRCGKSYMYEGGIREPLLVRWPKNIPAGQKTDALISTPDFYPTILECCGIPLMPNQHIDGQSFRKVLLELGCLHDRGPVFWHYPHYNGNGAYPASAVIEDDWKLIEWHEGPKYELFNLKEDIGEKQDMSAQFPDVVNHLKHHLLLFKADTKAVMPKINPNYDLRHAKRMPKTHGLLSKDEAGELVVKVQISHLNTDLLEVPFGEVVEEFLNRPINLKVGDIIRPGMLSIDAHNDVSFADLHGEQNSTIDAFLRDYLDKSVWINCWDQYPPELLQKMPHLLPQVEIICDDL